MQTIHTIGHSDHSLDAFLALLAQHAVAVLADVRSAAFSRRLPHFSGNALAASLKERGVRYAYLGEELGGRPSARVRAQMKGRGYPAMAATPTFQQGIARVMSGSERFRIALMCAERDPLECHRALLVGRALAERGLEVQHILGDGSLQSQPELAQRLLQAAGHANANDLFADPVQLLDLAYRRQAQRVSLEDAQERSPA